MKFLSQNDGSSEFSEVHTMVAGARNASRGRREYKQIQEMIEDRNPRRSGFNKKLSCITEGYSGEANAEIAGNARGLSFPFLVRTSRVSI